MALMEFVD